MGSGELGTQKGTFGGVAEPLDEKDGHGYTIFGCFMIASLFPISAIQVSNIITI